MKNTAPEPPPTADRLRPKLGLRLTRRRFLAGAAAGLSASVGGLGAYARWIEPHWVGVQMLPMPLVGLPESLVGRRLVQISDLHVGPLVDDEYLRRAMRRVTELEPDILAITGDFMTAIGHEQIEPTLRMVSELPIASTPTVAVLGNHDFGETIRDQAIGGRLALGLRRLGVQVLRNSSVEIDGVQFAGSGDLWAGECNVWQALAEIDNRRPAIALAHNPDTVDLAGWERFNGWILSGHTHGGQCRFPGWGPPILPVRNRRYAAGHVPLDTRRDLYVNRGLGYTRQVRFAAPPEITQFTLERA